MKSWNTNEQTNIKSFHINWIHLPFLVKTYLGENKRGKEKMGKFQQAFLKKRDNSSYSIERSEVEKPRSRKLPTL